MPGPSVVSIILPTYNRAKFLPEAIAAIRDQQFTDWELIVVDDGSTDETAELLPRLIEGMPQPYRFIRQENRGAYAARNRGLDYAAGKYIAFYDSDDLWLPHHLVDCVRVLEEHTDVDWVYSATKVIDQVTGEMISDNCFIADGEPRPFLAPTFQRTPNLLVIPPQEALKIALNEALYCGLQTSVIRRNLFRNSRLPPFRIGEDQVFSITSAAAGATFACVPDVHVIYRQHASNTSSSPRKLSSDNQRAREQLVLALSSLLDSDCLWPESLSMLQRRLNREIFWGIGYQYQVACCFTDARQYYRRASSHWPWSFGQYKTFACSYIHELLHLTLFTPRASTHS